MTVRPLLAGIDVGSTTVKLALVDPDDGSLVYSAYERHGSRQRRTAQELVERASREYPGLRVKPVFCGSGSRDLAIAIGVPYIQEVVANAVAVRRFHPRTRVSIELGGQDAKVTFFHRDEATGSLVASDMRMNGSCAGGTGAFLDEVAGVLKLPVESLNEAAERGVQIYDISGRCGVFAKTDIQPLLNQGVDKPDIARSAFHAVAKQTIGGLAQGLEIVPPVIFEGGPLTFNPELVAVFAERLQLAPDQIIRAEHPEILIAWGAALGGPQLYPDAQDVDLESLARHTAFTLTDPDPSMNDARVANAPLFASSDEEKHFKHRHEPPQPIDPHAFAGTSIDVVIGIDAGSTTTKFVMMTTDGQLVDEFYARNAGEPIEVVRAGLLEHKRRWDELGIRVNVVRLATTGYGEQLFAAAFGADYHTVETVAHAEAALHYEPGASFVLDIGGQDMKALFLDDGIVTGITLNEACSAGCGSFLENFASSLSIPATEIADYAFRSTSPSQLGSRCTVFMNSSIITEQKNGKTPEDIMAGVCRSIVENVFSKVIRLSNLDAIGKRIVVQGGTFKNDAVLRALELYVGRSVVRAPYPGTMGAIGIALLALKHHKDGRLAGESRFIGWEALARFTFEKQTGLVCPLCTNSCRRTVISFPNGNRLVTGNRCERGEVVGDPKDPASRERLREIRAARKGRTDLFRLRQELLFRDPVVTETSPRKDITIGLPRALEMWSTLPFWRAFFGALGFRTLLSPPSTKKLYETGLQSVPSDTACFPAKLSHGHLRALIDARPDRIFMPIMNRMIPENPTVCSNHACAVLKGYPAVLRIADEPETRHGIPTDTPVFHWVDQYAKVESLVEWTGATFGIPRDAVVDAVDQADRVQAEHRAAMQEAGQRVLDALADDEFAVVVAGRPYHSDPIVNHELPEHFLKRGIQVLPLEALPDLDCIDLTPVRAELTVNYHVRMFAAAILVARDPRLEFVQIVSFGCGHDAVVGDEVTRLLAFGGKSPLNLKMDESDISGPLNIRVQSFIETIAQRRRRVASPDQVDFPAPYATRYQKEHRKTKTLFIPNVSRSFSVIASAALRNDGFTTRPLPMAGSRAANLGKKFVHNDMCYPAQINIGEMLAALEDGSADPDNSVLALAKSQCDCRLAHYAMMARHALDSAGYPQVTIITTDEDLRGLHPDYKQSALFEYRMLWGLVMADALEELRRKMRPYELVPGSTDALFDDCLNGIDRAFDRGVGAAFREFKRSMRRFAEHRFDRSNPRPRVFVIGEFLLNFHPESNGRIERYLEDNGMEVILPDLFNNLHREFLLKIDQKDRYHVRFPAMDMFITRVTERFIRHVLKTVDTVKKEHPLYSATPPLASIADRAHSIIDRTFTSGEGWMIPGEILHHAEHGVDSFLILQPFGCLPNHVTGRGIVKAIKQQRPDVQILALDYDPDTSFANVENRLQMLIITAKERHPANQSRTATAG
ncbi:MAG: activase [Spirochaetaceae bacterium]|nr:MAG: activase [Spirochaetaceae bacterium]